jgi:hypothetical protein
MSSIHLHWWESKESSIVGVVTAKMVRHPCSQRMQGYIVILVFFHWTSKFADNDVFGGFVDENDVLN